MKVILPAAGKGTRLLPLTKVVPKPLIRVAGRTVLDYIIDKLAALDVEELIFITGHLKEQLEAYVRATVDIPSRFVEQEVQDGTAGAVNLARPYVDGPIMIIFVDTVMDVDLTVINRVQADGIIWVNEVEDYERFGVVVTDEHGFMQRIIEKPSEPISRLANVGFYYIQDWQTLFEGIEHTLAGPQMKGEWFLTEAFQYMIDHGKKLRTVEVDGWYDCGKVGTVLDTNFHLLKHGRAKPPAASENVRIVDPVYVADGVELHDVIIGPNVSIDAGSIVRSSTVRHCIIGKNARVERSFIENSLLGDDVQLIDRELQWIVAADGEIGKAP